METIVEFEDLLNLLNEHDTRYLIIGGMAFIFHAKPRYTKDLDLWIDAEKGNIEKANRALADFGSPYLLEADKITQITQLGIAPHRIDLLLDVKGQNFNQAWEKRVVSNYGKVSAKWIDLDTLLDIKSAIEHPKHKEDARVLKKIKEQQKQNED